MAMLRPDFGLSRDNDTFILSIAPSMWGMFAVLFHRHRAALKYFLGECVDIVRNVNPHSYEDMVNCGCWALHLAAEARDESAFEEVRRMLNGQSGLPPILHRQAHSGGSSMEDSPEWNEVLSAERQLVPELDVFTRDLSRESLPPKAYAQRACDLALAGIAQDACLNWGPEICALLHAVVKDESKDVSSRREKGA